MVGHCVLAVLSVAPGGRVLRAPGGSRARQREIRHHPRRGQGSKRTRESLSADAVPYFAQMDKGLLVKPADGAAYPKEILEIAALTKLTAEQVRKRDPRPECLDRVDRR